MTFDRIRCIITKRKEEITMGTSLFDLIAVLYRDIIKFGEVKPHTPLDTDRSDALEEEAKNILNCIHEKKGVFDGEMCLNSRVFYDIINHCQKENNFLLYRSVLCQLDSMIDIDCLIEKHDFNKYDNGITVRVFNRLNTNHNETGINIIPRVKSLADTFYVIQDSKYEDKEYKNANYWYDNINDHFSNVICLSDDMLDGYAINNVIIDLFKERNRDDIVIGITPGCNYSLNELMKVNEYCDRETGKQHFEIIEYYNPQLLTDKFLKCVDKAKENQVDILIGTEMLGTAELCETDKLGFNQHFRGENGLVPHLIVTPSFWHDGKNYISAYLKTGELIGRQYKQNCFEVTDDGKRYEEDLTDIPKEVLLIHVPGWGRITFPICVDLLVARYRDLLARHLKSNLILCPSYSDGTVQFVNASGTVRDFGTRLVWLNSCSALRKFDKVPKSIGFVSVPATNPEDMEVSPKIISPKCNGNCHECCLFTITIQALTKEKKHCNDVEIKHVSF